LKREEANRVLVLTPPGPAAIAVVRLVGEGTGAFLKAHFSRPLSPGRAVHGTLTDGQTIVDDPLILLHEEGRVADISLHGGPWVVRQVLELAQRAGFELFHVGWASPTASPDGGQCPPYIHPDAVDGDEIDCQMLMLMPLARTELALRALTLRALTLRRRKSREDFLADSSLRRLVYPPRVAIVGPPNAGKSTLANQLFAQERSIMTDTPGTTRDWVGEIADIDGLAVFLIDTPGLRETNDPIERTAIEASRPVVQGADLVVLVVDATHALSEQADWARRFPRALVVRNKCDLEIASPSPGTPGEGRGEGVASQSFVLSPQHSFSPHVYTIAKTGLGIDHLRQQIRRQFIRGWHQP
jgi:tRNA modification GTPase